MVDRKSQMEAQTATVKDPRDNLGPTIRAVRKARGLRLAQVAQSAGISESWLSQVERGRAVPSIEILFNLASALGLAMHDLFSPRHPGQLSVLTEAERPRINWGEGGAYKTLVTLRADTAVDAFVGHFPPKSSTGTAYTHGDSSEILFVLTGEVIAHVDGCRYVLRPGSSLEYRTSAPHEVHNSSSEDASVLWMVSPPTSGSVVRQVKNSPPATTASAGTRDSPAPRTGSRPAR